MTLFPGNGTGTSSFGAVAFWCVQQGARARKRRGRSGKYQRSPIPYGDNAVLEMAGRDDPQKTRRIVLKSTDWDALYALVGTRQTLSIVGDPAISAYLADLGDGDEYEEGYIVADLQFEF